MNPNYIAMCGDEDGGTDLNRNWGIDWHALDENRKEEVCGEYWPGATAFSEPESVALRTFVKNNKNTLKFVINVHTSGQDFIWPFNGKDPNDLGNKAPAYLQLFQDIQQNAIWPQYTKFGNSAQVMGEKMGGDTDDYILSKYGIPSVTAELGEDD